MPKLKTKTGAGSSHKTL